SALAHVAGQERPVPTPRTPRSQEGRPLPVSGHTVSGSPRRVQQVSGPLRRFAVLFLHLTPPEQEPHMNERRTNRSDVPGGALRLYSQALADRHRLRALALSNEDGLLIAGTAAPGDEALDLDWIGAVGCVCALGDRRGPSLGALVERVTAGRHLHS